MWSKLYRVPSYIGSGSDCSTALLLVYVAIIIWKPIQEGDPWSGQRSADLVVGEGEAWEEEEGAGLVGFSGTRAPHRVNLDKGGGCTRRIGGESGDSKLVGIVPK